MNNAVQFVWMPNEVFQHCVDVFEFGSVFQICESGHNFGVLAVNNILIHKHVAGVTPNNEGRVHLILLCSLVSEQRLC